MGEARGASISRAQWAGFFVLCLLGASGWLVNEAWPSVVPAAERVGLHDLVLAIALGGVGWRSVARGSLRGRPWMKLAVASVFLLGVPSAIVETALGGVSGATIAALFALVPVVVAVLIANFNVGSEATTDANWLFAPALAGATGILLLLPVVTPGSWLQAKYAALVLLGVLMVAAASVWMYRLLAGFAVIEAAAICCLANAAFFAVVFVASGLTAGGAGSSRWGGGWSWSAAGVEMLKAVCFGLPQVVLLVWLTREIAPVRFAARFLGIPLLSVIEGDALLRLPVTWRAAGGAALVVFGAWRLMTASERGEEPGLMLR